MWCSRLVPPPHKWRAGEKKEKRKKKKKEKRKRKKKIKGEEEEELKDLIRCMELCVLRYSITVFQINPVFRELSMLLLLLPWSPCALLADHGKLAHYIVASLTTLRLSRLLCVALQHILHSVSAWGMSPSFNVSVTWWKSPTCCCGAVVCLQSLRLSVMVTVSALFCMWRSS